MKGASYPCCRPAFSHYSGKKNLDFVFSEQVAWFTGAVWYGEHVIYSRFVLIIPLAYIYMENEKIFLNVK